MQPAVPMPNCPPPRQINQGSAVRARGHHFRKNDISQLACNNTSNIEKAEAWLASRRASPPLARPAHVRRHPCRWLAQGETLFGRPLGGPGPCFINFRFVFQLLPGVVHATYRSVCFHRKFIYSMQGTVWHLDYCTGKSTTQDVHHTDGVEWQVPKICVAGLEVS